MSLLGRLQAALDGSMGYAPGCPDPEPPPRELPPEHGRHFVADSIGAHDARPERMRGGLGYIHASSLLGGCPRKLVLDMIAGDTLHERVGSSMRLVWAYGRAAEEHARSAFIGTVGRSNVWGQWACRCGLGSSVIHGWGREQAPQCPRCRGRVDIYREAVLFDHARRIVGSPDLVYRRPDDGRMRGVELKSKAKHLFEPLMRPETDHVIRTFLYQRMLAGAHGDSAVDPGITVLYINKGYSFAGSPYKEFQVQASADMRARVDGLLATAQQVADAANAIKALRERAPAAPIPGEVIPPRLGACTSFASPTAKACARCGACFARGAA